MKIKVIELFAGVGGFRIGLEGFNNKSASSNYKEPIESIYETIWSNQWEPSTKIQHASNVYINRFGVNGHCNEDLNSVIVNDIPDHDMLVGGFPCQNYSVASTSKNATGLIGKKGVLWWNIHNILNIKKPKYLFLENVDRLLISPSNQRGKDFAVILKSLDDLGYIVEWRVINAAEYGMPQRRKRTFILAYLKDSDVYKKVINGTPQDWINEGTITSAFPINIENKYSSFELEGDIVNISENFNKDGKGGKFENTGIMVNSIVTTVKSTPNYKGNFTMLKDIILDTVSNDFYIKDEEMPRWCYLKGSKSEMRTNTSGFTYKYSEGGMTFPDTLDRASRTVITGEGGKSASRFKHVIKTDVGYRRLCPIELERLNMFPDNHTLLDKISDTKRAFFMGNALVVGVIEKIGIELSKKIEK